MMAPDRRRRSPEGSSISRRHKDSRADYNEPPRMRATPQSYPYSSSSSSSSSNSIVDISHSYPPKRSGIRTFFTTPSERKLRKRRSSRLMKNSNSSSSSINSDLAYGHGYIKRPKLRRVRSRSGREIDRERHGERYNERQYERQSDRYSDREGGKLRNNERARDSAGSSTTGARGNMGTTAGILAVGAGLRAIAAEQNKRDLREARNGKKPELSSVRDSGGHSYIESRGIGPSRPSHGPDEDGWESASDSESSVDSRLAFGNDTSAGWSFFGKKKYKPMSRKSSVVDPRLFGPENSLHGVVTQPVGFGDVTWTSTSDFGDQREAYQRDSYSVGPQQSFNSSTSQVTLQQIPPMPMSEVDRNELPRYTSEPQGYTSTRPDPVPIQIQHPKPRTPVSQSVYEPVYPTRSEPIYPTRSESGGILKKTNSSSGHGKSLAGAAVAGVAAAAVGSMISSSRDDRKDRQREDEIEALEKDRLRRRDSEKRESKDEKRDKRSSPPREDRKDKRRDKDKEDTEERRRDKKRDERRGETRDEKEDRREKRREERRATDRSDVSFDSRRTKSEAAVSTTHVDPFQYQVDQTAFANPTIESSSSHKRIESVPTVVTVERVPDFSRKRSSSIKSQPAAPVSEPRREFSSSQRGFSDRDDQEQRYRQVSEPARQADWDEKERRNRGSERRDRVLHDAEATIHDSKHFTGPYEAAVVSAVVGAEHHRETRADQRRRERQQDANYDDYNSSPRDKTPARDPIQEEADRAYREIVMARKIASQVIRSRSPSPDPSVVHKYEHKDQEEEVIRIVTPPGMEEHKGKGPYDAPNADFRLDHVLEHPKDLQLFSRPSSGLNRSIAEPIRDPDASKPRPHLNLVRPTPTPSPMPEKQIARSEPGGKTKSKKDREPPNRSSSSDIIIGPKGNIIASPAASNVSKGVTWGENETKHFEVESPSEHRDEFVSKTDIKSRESTSEPGTPKGDKGWGAVAAGIVGAGVGATVASEMSKSSKSQENAKPVPYEYRGVVVEPESPARREEYRGVIVEPESPPQKQRQRSPPSPGPKPTMSQSNYSNHMPGAFDDDFDFTATVAAGLQDTGFDPNIVIDDPTFRRRDSPPGSNDHGFYQAPFAETVTDLGMNPSEISRTRGTEGFVIGEVASTPQDWPVVSPTENDDSYSKLSKKDQKKRDKALKRQSADATPTEVPSMSREVVVEPESYFEAPLSKKEQKKRDKAAKRQSSQADDITPFSEPPVAADIVQEPESYFETPKKSKKSKGSSTYDDSAAESPRERTVSVPVNAFDDLQNGEDDWVDSSKKSKKKSKRDSDRYDSPVRSAAVETTSELERSSSKKSKRDSDRYESPARSAPSDISSSGKKSKDKSNRRSGQFDFDPSDVALPPSGATSEISSVSKKSKDKSSRRSEQYEYDPTQVSLPPSTPSEMNQDGEYEDARSTRRSSTRDSGIFNSEDRGDSRSVVSTSTSRYDDHESRKKKKSRSSTADFDDTRSVASAPAGDDYEDKKGKKKDKKSGGIFSGFFGGSKSESGARDESPKRSKDDLEDTKKKSKKSKRSSVSDGGSLYGDIGSASVNDLSRSISNGHSNGNSNGSYAYDDGNDDGARSDGERKKKTRTRSESTSSKKDSFLGKAGTLGAGVGIAGVTVAAIAAHHHQQSKAGNTNSNVATKRDVSPGSNQLLDRDEVLDPEITQRLFRPSIDPQYGDLLPLPPSDPASPNVEPLDDLPNLPDSRPDTPESERLAREKVRNVTRRNVQETPMKSPSHSQVPLKFKLGGNRSIPPSPVAGRSSPLPSPANPGQESLGFPRHRSRPSSWDNSKEFKPLYLVESTRRGSTAQLHADDELLPELPPSQRTSRSSSQLTDTDKSHAGIESRGLDPLSIDTRLASAPTSEDFLGSGQSTPKANVFRGFEDIVDSARQDQSSDPTVQLVRSSSPTLEKSSGSFGEDAAKIALAAGLASTIGYFASTPSHPKTNESWLNDLPSAKDQPSASDLPTTNRQLSPVDTLPSGEPSPYPVDAVTKDRSSYLLRSSPMSKKFEDFDSNDGIPGSPSGKESSTDRDTLDSIQEKDLGAVEPGGTPHNVNDNREKTLETLSGGNDLTTQQLSHEIEEPSDEFALKKSKKDKKKDKKGKGLSRSGTQDDVSLPKPSTSQMPDAFSTNEADTVESFSKSKKDKKNKKKNNPISWDDNETVAQQADEPSNQVKADEPDSDTFFDAEQESFEQPIPEEKPAQQDDFSTPKGKKGKKDKKGKSKFAWEPEPEVFEESLTQQLQNISDLPRTREVESADLPSSVQIDDANLITSTHEQKALSDTTSQAPANEPRSIDEHASKPSVDAMNETPIYTTEPTAEGLFEDFPSSKKKGKKDKRKSKTTSDWDESENAKSLLQDQPDLPDPSLEHAPTLAESNPAEDLFTSASKKDKKKNKKKGKATPWEDEETPSEPNPILTETSQDLSGDTFGNDDNAQFDDFTAPKSTGKKNKKTKADSWEPKADLPSANDTPTSVSASRDMPDDVSTPLEDPQPTDDFSFISKKDKKKKQKGKSVSAWDVEDDTGLQSTSIPASEAGVDNQEVPTPVEEPFEDFSSVKKKGKKDKKKSKSLSTWEPEPDDTSTQLASEPMHDRDVLVGVSSPTLDEPLSTNTESNEMQLESASPETTLATSPLPETQDIDDHTSSRPGNDEPIPEIKSPDQQPEIRDEVPAKDDFGFTESKKSKKKKGKASMSWADEVEASVPEPSPTTQLDIGQSSISNTLPVDEFEAGFLSKKDKKKKNKSVAAWEADQEITLPQSPIDTEEPVFTTSSSKKDKKKKGRKLQAWDEPETSQDQLPIVETSKNVDSDTLHDATASVTEKAASSKEISLSSEASKTLDTDEVLPARETPLSRPTPLGGPGGWPITPATPLTGGEQPSGEIPSSTSKGYFPAAAAAVSAVIFGSKKSRDDSSSRSKEPSMEEQSLTSLGTDEPPILETEPKSSPDGLTAGYDNTQLSLARQLQEEFGKKSSKKDKKKRQSLPSTPEAFPSRSNSRSRNIDEDNGESLRARSLSIGPASDRSGTSPAISERKNVYGEDQLEIARQLKADFESGSKKSKDKKSKKGRSYQDDDLFNRDFSDPQTSASTSKDFEGPGLVPETNNSDIVKPDGFAAGYQEDQLSLARQMQAEFAKKASKKDSKKDKKRRNTSQPPAEHEIQDEESEHQAQFPGAGPTQDDELPAQPQSTVDDNLPLRDGLAVGYTAEQLEIARQMKEDFGSGSKKKGKDKKDKKRGSLLRSNTEDDFSSDPMSGDIDSQQDFNASQPVETLDADDDFSTFGKKSKKKDKKGKRGSLLPTTPDHESTRDSGFEGESLVQEDGPTHTITGGELSAEPGSMEPEVDDFYPIGKKDKKSKKGKKSLNAATDGDVIDSPESSKQLDGSHGASEETPSESSSTVPVPEPEDDFAFSTKKSKKDKKKRQSSTTFDEFPDEQTAESRDMPSEQSSSQNPLTEPAANPEEEFAFSTKKSKKDKKKRQSSTAFDEFPDEQTAESRDMPSEQSSSKNPLTEPAADPEEEFAFSTKKSKKDKKNRKSSTVVDELSDQQIADSQDIPSEDLPVSDAVLPSPLDDEAGDDFGFSSKKKDKKKKRGSLLRNESFNANTEEQSEDVESAPPPENQIESPLPVEEPIQEDFEFSSKKSKKDKKKRGSLLRNESFNANNEEQTEDLEFVTPSDDQIEPVSPPVEEPPQDDFEFSSKKSKKDKKKRGSLLRNESFNAATEQESKDIEPVSAPDGQVEDLSSQVDELLQDDFEYSSKKSKKDKKKRGSLLRNESFNATTEPEPEVLEPVSPLESQTEAIPSPADEPLQDEFEFTSKKSKKDKKKRGSLLRNESFNATDEPTPQSLISQGNSTMGENSETQLEDATVTPETRTIGIPSEVPNVASVQELSSGPAQMEEKIALDQSASQDVDPKPEDDFEDFAFTKKSKKKDKKRKDSTKFEDISEASTSLNPFSEPKITDEPTLPADPEATTSIGHEEKDLDTSAAPITDQPDDDWGDFSTKKSKKKKRKDSSKPDSEEISIPSEPILEPSRDVALTPLPLDQTSDDNVAPELPLERDLESTATPDNETNVEEPADEWSSFSVKKSKKDKKKQKGISKEDFEDVSVSASPAEITTEPSQPTTSPLPDTTVTDTIELEKPHTPASDDLTPTATQEPEEPADEWGSFSTKKSKKGKKDKKSGSSTPIVPIVAAVAAAAAVPNFVDEDTAATSSRDVDAGDDWGNISSKKSKKGKKDKKSGLSTPTEENLPSGSAHRSVDTSKEPPLPADVMPEVLEQTDEGIKKTYDDPRAIDEEPAVTDTFEEWGSVPAKKSKDKKKKRSSGLDHQIEEAPVPEQVAEDNLGQPATFKDLDRDAVGTDIQSADAAIATEGQGDEWGDFPSKKSKKKDKKQKKSGLSTPAEEVPSLSPEVSDFGQAALLVDAVEDATVPVETSVDTRDVSENQEDEWASFSTKPSKKDRKKQKSSLSTPAETTFDSKLEEQTLETAKPSEIQSTDQTLQSVQPVDVETSKVVEDHADDWGASFVKPSKKDKKGKSKRSSEVAISTEQTVEPVAARDDLASDPPSIQPAMDEQVSEPTEQPTNLETKEVTEDGGDEWGSIPIKQSKGKGKKNRKSSLSTPIEEPLPQEESESLPAEAVQEVPSSFRETEATSSEQNVDVTEAQEEWNFSTPKSKKDKKKSRKSGISTPIEEPLVYDESLPIPADSVQEVPTSFDIPEATNSSQNVDSIDEQDEWSFSAPKSKKDKKKSRKSGISTPVEEPLPILAEVIQEVPSSSDIPEATSSSQNIDAIDEQDEWSFSAPKSKKDKKKSRKSGISTPVTESLPLPQTEASPEQSQTTDASLDNARELTRDTTQVTDPLPLLQTEALPEESPQALDSTLDNTREITQDTTEDTFNDPSDEWGSSSKKSKDKKKKKSERSIPAAEPISSLPSSPPPESTEHLKDVVDKTPFSAHDTPKDLVDDNQEDEWGIPSKKKKKDKKDKKKSGLLTPVEEPPLPIDHESSSDPVQQPKASLDETELPSQKTEVVAESPADDEWNSLPTKKGKKDKKDKKRKSGISTPVEEISTSLPEEEKPGVAEPSIVTEHSTPVVGESSSRDLEPVPDATEEVDDWGSFTKKKSKKDKKGRSGLSTPIEEARTFEETSSQSKDKANQPGIADVQNVERDLPTSDDINTGLHDQQPEDDSFGFESKSSKKSKKDKKRKSGLSTPIEEVQILEETSSQPKDIVIQPDIPEIQTSERELPTLDEANTELHDQLPEDDTFAFVTKPSKKSKKDKRKSGISTPIEEDIVSKADLVESHEDVKGAEESQAQSLAKDELPQVQQPSDGDFSFTPAKSKGKKSRKGSRAGSDSGPSTPAQPDLFSSLEPERSSSILGPDQLASPLAFEDNTEDLFTSDLSRKLSKKDKKKRQAAFDVASEGNDPVTASWADEIEEATVVRAVPIIEEIAEDQTLAKIAPTVESIPMDDFVRPSKKGKKGTKRNSISSQSTPLTEPISSPGKRDLPSTSSPVGSSSIPAVIASGAAIAGAALLSGTAMKSPTSETTTPAKKLSKKDKKKKSIDRRAPREDDIFDDPALWEGADPKVHEEEKEVDDDSDGFWSPPQQEEKPATIQEVLRETAAEEDRSISIPATEAAKPSSPTVLAQPEPQLSGARSPVVELYPSSSQDTSDFRDLPEPSRKLSDPDNEFVVSSSKKKDKKKKKNTSSSWDFEGLQDKEPEQPVNPSPAFNSPKPLGTSAGKADSFDQSQINEEHLFTPTRDLLEPQHSIREAPTSPDSSRNIQTERPKSRTFHSRLSDLPIVPEESSTQFEPDYHHGHDVDANRDSAFVAGSPVPPQPGFSDDHEHVRDSGIHLRDFSPAEKTRAPVRSSDDALERLSWPSVDEDSETVDLHRSSRSKDNTHHIKHHIKEQPSSGSHDSKRPKGETATDFYQAQRSTPTKHHDEETTSRDLLPSQRNKEAQHTDLHRTPTIHGPRKAEGQSLVKQRMQQFQQSEPADLPRTPRPKLSSARSSEKFASQISDYDKYSESPSSRSLERSKAESRKDGHHSDVSVPRAMDISKDDKQSSTPSKSERPKEAKYSELTSSPRPKAERSKGISDLEAGAAIAGATLGFAAARKHSQEQRPGSAQSQRSTSNTNINRLRTPDIHRPDSATSNRSGTPPLRRSDRKSGDLRSLSQRSKSDLAKEAELATSANSASAVNTANPTANEGRVRAKDMADVYDGFGEGRMGSPRSPTRPHSMRRRQSMQVLDLEQKLEQLAAENRMLAEAKAQADHALNSSQNAPSAMVEKDAEIDSLKRTLEWLQNEVTRLSEVNDGLTSANMTIARQHGDQYGILETQHTQTARELQEVRAAHENLSSGMEGIVRNEVQKAVLDKDREIAQLRAELDAAKEKIRDMQRQILATKANDVDFLTIRDEDYFDNACQKLCNHVQQWVLRFSKFSDMRACRLTSEINNDKTIDRLDNAILDGSDVDNYLADRVKRRDVFMSMTMTMVWEFIFTRYLFGMDREQRQKLKSLEKTLSEVGPAAAVHQWRATTLTLLAKRQAFHAQREQDTQAVVHAVLETLSEILPPPSHLETQIEEQLSRVMKAAVDLSIEMRCQRAEYMMLPPLQPEYDANGDLASKVSFNAALMNERSGDTVSNEDLENQKAVVRIVLFPLVVKKGDDSGEGDEEIVVCPAQVLVAKPKKSVRLMAPESNTSRMSLQSSMPAGDSVI
ncbi:hypothetical protein VTL71DRAFT_4036 [Oculimacula yallundae]|uniref:Involucrin repeat protein n=1 Tax=Oculimacula yallundae TaxID=86028 RepID=A0ABR4C5V4_9HELO